MTEEGRYQMECRALRNAAERSFSALQEAMKASSEEHTKKAIKAAIDHYREIAGVDFSCPIERSNYRPPGGC